MHDEVYNYAIRLLARREYSTSQLRARLERKFGTVPESTIDRLIEQKYLDDQRFAETYVRNKKSLGRQRLEYMLVQRGVRGTMVRQVLEAEKWPSLGDALVAKMKELRMQSPLSVREASRLSRVLERLGYEGEEIRDELAGLL